ncbi:hypothetical protein JD844_012825 [Phrynosoma platyrhinos]|uniref:Peptidase M16 C-terminal domain-containing protein n=1 Tax=Phrynosoma platyrhinos TaxID=52577 RepID=A0ABQ7TKV5_PHRPL|nr:hypothetical protein JD844_012825 [Phrynosoma platyrhinos]
MVLAAAGGVGHKELVDLAKQHFSNVPYEYKDDTIPILPRCRFTGSEIRVRDDALPMAHVAIAVEGPGWANPDNIPLLVANAVIGSYDVTFGGGKNQSSKLAAIAAETQICHSFQAFNTCYSDTGLFGFYFVSDGLHIEDTLHFAQGEWMSLCTSVTDSDVKRAKNTLRNSLVAQLDGISEDLRSAFLLHFFKEVDAKIVREVCSKYLYDKCPAVAAVGKLLCPVEQLPDYNRIRSAMYWLRF